MVSRNVIQAAEKVMRAQTKKNGAPAWSLTEISVEKGRHLARSKAVREDLVVLALYLAHSVFSKDIDGEIQRDHPFLSADFAKAFLEEQAVSNEDIEVVINAIQAHHDHVEGKSLEAEVMKNAEGFKFLSVEGAEIFLKDLQRRGMTLAEAKQEVKRKMSQKLGFLTFPECIVEARNNITLIEKKLDVKV